MSCCFRIGRNTFLAFAIIFAINIFPVFPQCPPDIFLSTNNASMTIDDFGDLMGGVTLNGATTITIDAGCVWDFYARLNPTPLAAPNPAYSTQGMTLPLTAINIRAVNVCQTPDHDYGAGTPPPPPRISGTFDDAFTAGDPNYIVGTAGAVDEFTAGTPCSVAGGMIEKNNGTCSDGLCDGVGTFINNAGDFNSDPNTHRFRIDIQIIPGVIPIITPGIYSVNIDFYAEEDGTGVNNMQSFTLQVEVLPILQLKMTTPTQIDFNFSDVKQYQAGIVKYGATILEVNSSLDWDLMAVGTSSNIGGLGPYWENSVEYSTGVSSSDLIPLEVLELRQTPANPAGAGAGVDYSLAFPALPMVTDGNPMDGATLNNNIEVAGAPYAFGDFAATTGGGKTIAGDWGSAAAGDSWQPGSYIAIDPGWNRSDFRYVIDYRIVPNLPLNFFGMMPAGTYARPGVYTMEVKYILSEDQ